MATVLIVASQYAQRIFERLLLALFFATLAFSYGHRRMLVCNEYLLAALVLVSATTVLCPQLGSDLQWLLFRLDEFAASASMVRTGRVVIPGYHRLILTHVHGCSSDPVIFPKQVSQHIASHVEVSALNLPWLFHYLVHVISHLGMCPLTCVQAIFLCLSRLVE